jgi:hypothetical protein
MLKTYGTASNSFEKIDEELGIISWVVPDFHPEMEARLRMNW